MAEHRDSLGALAALALAGVGSGCSCRARAARSCRRRSSSRSSVPVSAFPRFRRVCASDKAVSALPGDWLVETDRLRLVIGAEAPGIERRIRLGSLLDVAVGSIEEDDVRDIRTVLNVGSKSISTRVSGLTLAPHGPAPVVRARQHSHDGRIELETDYQVSPGRNAITITTRVTNATNQLIRSVQVGDRTLWPGEPSFAPRAGFVEFTSHAEVPWVGREGHKLCYVFDFAGQLFDASFLFDRIGPIGQATLSPPRDLPPRESFDVKRELIVARGGLDTVAELAWRRSGREVGWVEGTLDPAPTWATIEARYPDNKPALSVKAGENGKYRLALPPGDYRLVLKSSGGEDQEEVSIESERLTNANLLPPRPGMLRFSITDTDDAPIPARIQVRGIAPSKDPDFSPVESAVGAGNVVYTASGNGFIELPAGRYRVIVGHGSEYSMVESRRAQIAEDEGAAPHVVLGRVVDTAGYLACDFHVHADPEPRQSDHARRSRHSPDRRRHRVRGRDRSRSRDRPTRPSSLGSSTARA